MQLRPGIPRLSDLDALLRSDLYLSHTHANAAFLARHGPALAGYGRHWGQDPFKLWSRRWEYPFCGQRLLDFVRAQTDSPVRVLDAGSGVTYFDYFLADQCPSLEIVCVDHDRSYPPMFEAINRNVDHARVTFVPASLQQLPMEDASLDAVVCISVLEHTDRYSQILAEFARVTRRGGALVLTFDLSLDGRFELSRAVAGELLKSLEKHYRPLEIESLQEELEAMHRERERILSTDHVRRSDPSLLPWRYPMLKGVHDLLKGKGWTGGFRSKSVFCLDARRI